MRAAALGFAVLAVLAVLAGTASAHQSSVTHSDVVVDGAEVRYAIAIEPADLTEVAGADYAGAVAYVTARIAVLDGETPCPAADGTVTPDGARVRVAWTARCPAPVRVLVLEYDLFFDLDPIHEGVLRVRADGDTAETILSRDASRFVWDLGAAPPSGTLAFIGSGIDHILYGFDHIAFVLTLLLALVITRDTDGWRRRRFPEALRATAVIVTSFTVAHSITLIAASLGYVSVPAQVVESAIALSIAYTAVENIVRPDVAWRYLLTFAFGLLHGLGFARMLEELLPPGDVIVPLLAFNVGVELGQLAVVLLALPLAWLLAGAIGAARYRRLALSALSALLATLGLVWLAERTLSITLLGL